jgi:hypothetical protein
LKYAYDIQGRKDACKPKQIGYFAAHKRARKRHVLPMKKLKKKKPKKYVGIIKILSLDTS